MKQLHVNAWDQEYPENTLSRAHPGDAGLDLCASETKRIVGLGVTLVPTGLKVIIPEGCFGMLTLRSGWACEHEVVMPNAPGIIDSTYRGEIKVPIMPVISPMGFTIKKGTRFAQLTIVPYENVAVTFHTTQETWPEHKSTARGEDGFGSSGE